MDSEQQALLVIEQERDVVLSHCASVEVIDQTTEAQAGALLNEIKQKEKDIETFIKSWTDPLEVQKKRWFTVRNNLLKPILPIKQALNDALLKYRQLQINIAQKEQDRLRALEDKRRERAEKAGKPMPIPESITAYVPVPDKSIQTENGSSMTYSETWKAEVIDINLVPTFHNGWQILFAGVSELNAMARLYKGANAPPGVIFKKVLGTRAGR